MLALENSLNRWLLEESEPFPQDVPTTYFESISFVLERRKKLLAFPEDEDFKVQQINADYFRKKYEEFLQATSFQPDEESIRRSNIWHSVPFRKWTIDDIIKRIEVSFHKNHSLMFLSYGSEKFMLRETYVKTLQICEMCPSGSPCNHPVKPLESMPFSHECDFIELGTFERKRPGFICWTWVFKDRRPLIRMLPPFINLHPFILEDQTEFEEKDVLFNVIAIEFALDVTLTTHLMREKSGQVNGFRNLRKITKQPTQVTFEMMNENLRVNSKKRIKFSDLKCRVCSKEENLRKCGKCNIAKYCSRECQVTDWKTHKKTCAYEEEIEIC